tara:strand:- start:156 stop:320 length:165 start_codon:yes stop_codon:yes gene_type:complete
MDLFLAICVAVVLGVVLWAIFVSYVGVRSEEPYPIQDFWEILFFVGVTYWILYF